MSPMVAHISLSPSDLARSRSMLGWRRAGPLSTLVDQPLRLEDVVVPRPAAHPRVVADKPSCPAEVDPVEPEVLDKLSCPAEVDPVAPELVDKPSRLAGMDPIAPEVVVDKPT